MSYNEHRSALRGTSRGGFAGVPYALNLELYFSVFLKPISLSLRGVGVLCYTAVSRNLSPPFPLLHCAWLVVRVRVLWACCVALQSEPEPDPPLLHFAWLVVRVGVLWACCVALQSEPEPDPPFSTALGWLCACCATLQSEPEPEPPVLSCAWLVVRVGVLWACCVALQSEPEPPPLFFFPQRLACCARSQSQSQRPRSPLRLACCARGQAVGVLCCVLCSRGSALCSLLRVDLLCRIAVGGDSPSPPTSSAPGLADALCNLLAWPAATPVSARPVQRSVYTQCYQTNGAC